MSFADLSQTTRFVLALAACLGLGAQCQAADYQPSAATSESPNYHYDIRSGEILTPDPVRSASTFQFMKKAPQEPLDFQSNAKSKLKLPTLRFLSSDEPSQHPIEPTAMVSDTRRYDSDVVPAGYNSRRGSQLDLRNDVPPQNPSDIRFMQKPAYRSAPPALAKVPQSKIASKWADMSFFHRNGASQIRQPQVAPPATRIAGQSGKDRSSLPPQAIAARPLPPRASPPLGIGTNGSPAEPVVSKASPAAVDTAQTMKPTAEPRLVSPNRAPTETSVAIDAPLAKLLKSAHEKAASAESEADYTKIVSTCRKALAEEPGEEVTAFTSTLTAWALNRRGQLRADAGRNKEAFTDFADAIELDATCWRAIHNRGVLRAEAGDFKAAFDDFNRTIELSPRFAKAYVNRASLSVLAGDFYAALRDYRQAINYDPQLVLAHKGRAQVYHVLGNLTEAQNSFDAAAKLAPDDASIAVAQADLLTDLGQYDEARAEYERALKLDSELAQAYRGSAWLLATCPEGRVRDSDRALDDAYAAIELDGPQDPANLDTLAAALANSGDFDGAVAAQKRAITLSSESERDIYRSRLSFYEQSKPFRISPIRHAQAIEPIDEE